ncbi:tRNA(adenine34) deaminase [Desulfocicer vacuolatum DSM 3385]|uniref:tRNA(Adenine34) deaminase n=2 Tax=Desulfocicer vacuolatum TaxID=2298 RepID=A0A1W1ZV84_9BACT|nr:nucleoside deaminase [Desulfocicer vacuolatum]SMC52359.1 tRNA(adenine34) deaminase [Desulfocicer vacuolatum DSM 3385]
MDEQCMSLALEAAEAALARGDFPVGCVIMRGADVVATGARQGTADDKKRASELDHAEILALRHLESLDVDREGLVLYCTMEPCLMCFAAIMLSGIKKVVFAYEDVMGGGTGCDRNGLSPLYRDCGIRVIPGVLRRESLSLFYRFFRSPQNVYWKDSLLEKYTLEQGENSLGIGI